MYEPEHSLEPSADIILGYCDHCGGEVYKGETIYRIDGYFVHEDCLPDFAREYFAACKEEVGIHV